MRDVLLLQATLPFHGGVAGKFTRLVTHLPRGPIHVGCHLDGPDCILPDLAAAGTPVVCFGTNNLWRLVWRLRRYIVRNGIGAVFACSFRAWCAARVARLGLPCRSVFWISDNALTRKPVKHCLFRLLCGQDWLLASTQLLLDQHSRPGRPRTALLLNGVAPPAVASDRLAARRELNIPERGEILLYAADCIPYKDHQTLLLAFCILATRHPDLYLVLCGNPGRLPALAENPAVLGPPVSQRVIFFGPRRDLHRFYAAADIYTHPCPIEAFGNAAVEAMMAGLPVVVAAGCGLNEVVGDGGLSFEPRNPASLAAAIEDLLRDPAARAIIAERGRQRALTHYSMEQFVENFVRLRRLILEDREP